MNQSIISTGSRVKFDSDSGPQTGTVQDIKTDLGNGAKVAFVRVIGTLDGAAWRVPVNELQRVEAA